jgi:hypothetical protein
MNEPIEEQWKAIGGGYEISNQGNLKLNGETKQPYLLTYKQIHIDKKMWYLHHLVAREFIGERPEGTVIDHIDRNKHNNAVTNLRYITQAENMRNSSRYRSDVTIEDPLLRRRELNRQTSKRHYDDETKDIKAKKKAYYLANKEKLSAYMKNYYHTHKKQKEGLLSQE